MQTLGVNGPLDSVKATSLNTDAMYTSLRKTIVSKKI